MEKKDANDRQISDLQWESRLVFIEGQGRPTPRTKESVTLMLAKKTPANKRSKKNFQGLYGVLRPRSTVVKEDKYNFVKKRQAK